MLIELVGSVVDHCFEPLPQLLVHVFDLNIHILLMGIVEKLDLFFDVAIDSQESWYLFGVDVHKILVREIVKQVPGSFSHMVRQEIEECVSPRLVLLRCNHSFFSVLSCEFIVDELVEAIFLR